jgi:hypothetical protein
LKLRELTQALSKKDDVRWGNDGYHVSWSDLPDGPAIVITHDNGFGGAMDISEIKNCYIKEGVQTCL